MIVTITNTSGVVLNDLETIDTSAAYGNAASTAGVVAVGGNKVKPLPYPFGHIGALAISGTKALPMHPSDWRYKSVPWVSKEPAQEWLDLIQKGYVTVATGAESTSVDPEELFIHSV